MFNSLQKPRNPTLGSDLGSKRSRSAGLPFSLSSPDSEPSNLDDLEDILSHSPSPPLQVKDQSKTASRTLSPFESSLQLPSSKDKSKSVSRSFSPLEPASHHHTSKDVSKSMNKLFSPLEQPIPQPSSVPVSEVKEKITKEQVKPQSPVEPSSSLSSHVVPISDPKIAADISHLTDKLATCVSDIQRLYTTFQFKSDEAISSHLVEKQRFIALREAEFEAKLRDLSSERSNLVRERGTFVTAIENSNRLALELKKELEESRIIAENQSVKIDTGFDNLKFFSEQQFSLLQKEREDMVKLRNELSKMIELSSKQQSECQSIIDDYAIKTIQFSEKKAELEAQRKTVASEISKLTVLRQELEEERTSVEEVKKNVLNATYVLEKKSREFSEEKDRFERDFGQTEALVSEIKIAKKEIEDEKTKISLQWEELRTEQQKIAKIRNELKSEIDYCQSQRSMLNKALEDYHLLSETPTKTSRPHSHSRSMSSIPRYHASTLQKLRSELAIHKESQESSLNQQREFLSGHGSRQQFQPAKSVSVMPSVSNDLTSLQHFSAEVSP
ncbi:hypothetical protein RCL1_001322 [Eukaryota sp. TZLM3-RCL]